MSKFFVIGTRFHLFNPVNNHSSTLRELLQSLEVYKHGIPFEPKIIIPEEISNQFWSCILKNSSAAIDYGADLWTRESITSYKSETYKIITEINSLNMFTWLLRKLVSSQNLKPEHFLAIIN